MKVSAKSAVGLFAVAVTGLKDRQFQNEKMEMDHPSACKCVDGTENLFGVA